MSQIMLCSLEHAPSAGRSSGGGGGDPNNNPARRAAAAAAHEQQAVASRAHQLQQQQQQLQQQQDRQHHHHHHRAEQASTSGEPSASSRRAAAREQALALASSAAAAAAAATASAANMAATSGVGAGHATQQSSMDEDDSYPLPTIYRCRAPIASLDCMEEFNGGAATDSSGHYGSTPGTKEHLLASCLVGSQSQRLQHSPSPGIRYRNLGKSGLRVSNVGLGTWTTFGGASGANSEENAEAVITLAYESGINVFDLSEAHSGPKAEIQLGRILQKRNWNRTSYIVTTKIYWNPKSEARGLSRKYIIETVQASLARLQLSYIDIVMIHKVDPTCPMEEIVRAMNYVISKGWAMYWGTSRWSPVEIMEAYSNCRQFNCVTPIVEQAEYHLFYRDKPELYMPELYNKIGVGLMCWSTMSIGMISARGDDSAMSVLSRSRSSYREQWRKSSVDSESRKYSDKVRDMCALAERLGCTFTQLAIAWSLKNESVQCLLLGATNIEQLYESLQSLQLIPRLTVATMTEIERILLNKPSRPPMVSTLQLR